MPILTPRFTLLSILCSLATQSLSPSYVAHAAVIARSPTSHGNDDGLHQNQVMFSSPWAQKGEGYSSGTNHKVQKRSHLALAASNNHGGRYRVNHRRQASTPAWAVSPRNNSSVNSTASTGPDCTPGVVAIMSSFDNSEGGKPVAYLVMAGSPGNYIFDASETTTGTQLCLADDIISAATSGNGSWKRVMAPMVDIGREYCATYDPDPSGPSPLSAEPCLGAGEHEAHKSQTFLYEPSTGVIRPTLPQGDPRSGSTQPSNSSSSSASPSIAATNASSSAVPSASSTTASQRRRDDNFSSQSSNSGMSAHNVTLVFIPERTTNNESATVSAASTSTVTQTVTVYSSSSPSVLYAASATPSASSSAAAAFVTGLNVEIVGGAFSSVSASGSGMAQATGAVFSPALAASSSYGMAAATPAASMASSAAVSPSASVNVAEVVESIIPSYSAVASSTPVAFGAASASASGLIVSSSASPSSSADPSVASYAAELLERNASPIPDSTDPYFWRFKADRR